MIGSLVLQNCLNSSSITEVVSIARKPLGISNPKLVEIMHQNFLDFSGLREKMKDIDLCFYCLGVYTGKVPTSEFITITVDFTSAFANALKESSPQATFCFLSGQGADSTEKSKVLFARQKGIAENHLFSLQFGATYIFRPGYIYPVTPRKEPNAFYKLLRQLFKPVAAIYPNIGVTSQKLAEKMVNVGLNGAAISIFENKDIRA